MAEPDEPKKIEPDQQTEGDAKPAAGDGDPATDRAVDDITRQEGDDELKAQDAAAKPVVMKQNLWERFRSARARWWHDPRKKWGSIAGIVLAVAALFAVPLTRYEIIGLFVHAKVTVQITDSKTNTPVSGAAVRLGGAKAETDGEGKAVLHPHAGSQRLSVSKKYYDGASQRVLVTLSSSKNVFKTKLTARGRQVQFKLTDKISGKPVADATVKAGDVTAKTDKNGVATVVLPGSVTTQESTVSASGYNSAKVTIDVSAALAKNTFSLTPAGKLYFLSNLSGTIDVVKTNLDGTGRQTVLAGTGSEDRYSTSLLASRDWKYLALLAKRSGDNSSVYLIDTTNGDKLSTIDEGDADFSLVGWSGDRFVYQVNRHGVSSWQPNQQALKSFDPTTGHTLLLDQTQGTGTSGSNYAGQQFSGVYLLSDQVVYAKNWQANNGTYGGNVLGGKSAELDTIGADGSGHKVVKSFAPDSSVDTTVFGYQYLNLNTRLYEPDSLYLLFDAHAGGQAFTAVYEYEGGKVAATSAVTANNFYDTPYPTYLLSPSGDQTFWADQRDGKNLLNIGDPDGKSPKQLGSLTDYNPYGWFTGNYLLVSKSSSELYIMPVSGGTPYKITDYYKPAINYQGYGGGYGGL